MREQNEDSFFGDYDIFLKMYSVIFGSLLYNLAIMGYYD